MEVITLSMKLKLLLLIKLIIVYIAYRKYQFTRHLTSSKILTHEGKYMLHMSK